MKKLNKILFALMLALVGGGISCVDDIKDVVAPKLTVSETQFAFTSEGGSQSFTVEANCAWTVNNSDPDWVTIDPTEGYGNGEITFFVPETTVKRKATISFTLISSDYGRWGKAEQMVTITQYPGDSTDPDDEDEEGDGTAEHPYTIAQALALSSSSAKPSEAVWVKGTIVGSCVDLGWDSFTDDLTNASATNIVIGNTDGQKMPVQLPSGKVRSALNLKDNPSLLNEKVALLGTLEPYFSQPGIKNTSDYRLGDGDGDDDNQGGGDDTPSEATATIAEILVLSANATIADGTVIEGVVVSNLELNNLTSKKGLYVQDETGGMQFYLAANHEFAFGTRVSIDLSGETRGEYNGAPQISGTALSKIKKIKEGETVTPITIKANEIEDYYGRYVAIDNVQVKESDLSNTFVMDGKHTSINVETSTAKEFVIFSSSYATYGSEKVPQGSGTLKGIASVNSGALQLIFAQASDYEGLTGTRFTASAGATETVGDGSSGNPFTTADVLALYENGETQESVWVSGTIVGYYEGTEFKAVDAAVATATKAYTFVRNYAALTEAYSIKNNIVIADDKDNRVLVELPEGADRDKLNLNDNPTNAGKTVYVKGNIDETAVKSAGVIEVTDSKIDDDGGSTDDPTKPEPDLTGAVAGAVVSFKAADYADVWDDYESSNAGHLLLEEMLNANGVGVTAFDTGTGSSKPAWFRNASFRIYKGNNFTVKAGLAIAKIEMTFTGSTYATTFSASTGSGTLSGTTYTWTPKEGDEVTSVVFTNPSTGTNGRISEIKVTLAGGEPEQPEDPTTQPTTIADLIKIATDNGSTAKVIDSDVTYTFTGVIVSDLANGNGGSNGTIFVMDKDAANGIALYDAPNKFAGVSYPAGTVVNVTLVAGAAKAGLYNKLPQLQWDSSASTTFAANLEDTKETVTITPKEVTVSELENNLCLPVSIKNVTKKEGGKWVSDAKNTSHAFTAEDGTAITVYVYSAAKFGEKESYANTTGTLTGIVSTFNGVQVLPRSEEDVADFMKEASTTPEVKTEGEGTVENPYTGNDVQALYEAGIEATDVWVSGTIVGYYEGSEFKTPTAQTSFARAYNFISSYAAGEALTIENNIVIEDAAQTKIPIYLPEGEWRTKLNLKEHANYVNMAIQIQGDLTEFSTNTGGLDLSDAKYEAPTEPEQPEEPKVEETTIAALNKLVTEKGNGNVLNEAVTYTFKGIVTGDSENKNGSFGTIYVMAEDAKSGEDAIVLYNSSFTDGIYKTGDVIEVTLVAGAAKAGVYNDINQITWDENAETTFASNVKVTSTTTVTPFVVSVADLTNYVSLPVTVKDVTATASSTWSGSKIFSVNGTNLTVFTNSRATFAKETYYAATGDITGIVTLYNNNPQLAPRNLDDIAEAFKTAPAEPEPEYEFDGDGSEGKPYSVADVKYLYDKNEHNNSTKVWVSGEIIGYYSSKLVESTENASNTNLVIGSTDVFIPVQLPSGDVRNNLNLQDNPSNLNKNVALYGNIDAYFSMAGLKNVTQYTLEGGGTTQPDPDPTPTTKYYKKVTTVTAGKQYILVAADVQGSNYAFDVSTKNPTTSTTVEGAVITIDEQGIESNATNDAYAVTIEGNADSYTIKAGEGKYINGTTSSSLQISSSANGTWSVTNTDGSFLFVSSLSTSKVILFNNTTNNGTTYTRFGNYASSNVKNTGYYAITLYELAE